MFILSYIFLIDRAQKLFFVLLGVYDSISSLFIFISHLLSNSLLSLSPNPLKHWCILKHGGHYHKSNLRTTKIDLLNRHRSSIFVEHSHIIQSDVHSVFSISQIPSEHFSCFHLYCHNVVFGLVKKFYWSSNHVYFIRELL